MHHFGKIGDFDGGPYKHHFQNWEFDVSLLRIFGKKVYLFHHLKKIEKFSKINYSLYRFITF